MYYFHGHLLCMCSVIMELSWKCNLNTILKQYETLVYDYQ